jgi:hypothetical protein
VVAWDEIVPTREDTPRTLSRRYRTFEPVDAPFTPPPPRTD